MKRAVLALAVSLVALLGVSSFALAAQVEGTVKSIDATKQTVTLEDGTTLNLGPKSAVDKMALKPGARVKASYDVTDGKNMVTTIEVQPHSMEPSGTPTTPGTAPAPSDRPSPSTPRR
jgi:hypothetical protein